MTPQLVTSLVDNGASIEEALTNIVDSTGEQKELMSLRTREGSPRRERQPAGRDTLQHTRSQQNQKTLEGEDR